MQHVATSVREGFLSIACTVTASLKPGMFYVYSSVLYEDDDDVMQPVWEMVKGMDLNEIWRQVFEDTGMSFGKALGRVFEIVG